MAKLYNKSVSSFWRGYGARGTTLFHSYQEYIFIQPLWKSIGLFLRILEMNVPQDSAILLWGVYPKDTPFYHKDTYSTMFIVDLFIVAPNWEQPRCPNQNTDEEIYGTFILLRGYQEHDTMKFAVKCMGFEEKNHSE